MRVSEGQKEKIKRAFETNSKYITIRFGLTDLYGEDVIALTKSQVDRLWQAYEERKGFENKNVENAISPQCENRRRIFASVSRIDSIPNRNCFTRFRSWSFIGTGEFWCIKTNRKRMYLKKGSGVCRIETDGKGLYLGPASGKGFENVDNGLYLMKQGGLYDGSGLILGPNSPFKNIPSFGMIL